MFANGIEWLKIEEVDTGTGAGNVVKRANNTTVDGILVLGTGSIGGEGDDMFRGLLRTDGECDGKHGGHGNRDTTDQEHQDVIETAMV